MKENGLMIFDEERVMRDMLTIMCILESLISLGHGEREFISGVMEKFMMESGIRG